MKHTIFFGYDCQEDVTCPKCGGDIGPSTMLEDTAVCEACHQEYDVQVALTWDEINIVREDDGEL